MASRFKKFLQPQQHQEQVASPPFTPGASGDTGDGRLVLLFAGDMTQLILQEHKAYDKS